MAEFLIAYSKTKVSEGVYNNDKRDRGGETVCGVSRVSHPDLPLWKIVDEIKLFNPNADRRSLSAIITADDRLMNLIKVFYKNNYWDSFRGDDISDQKIADEIFDSGVLFGKHAAIIMLQRSLNAANRDQLVYMDIAVDGGFGQQTFNALGDAYTSLRLGLVLKMMNILQGAKCIDIMERDSSQENWAGGWINRVVVEKD